MEKKEVIHGDIGLDLVTELINCIVRDGCLSKYWQTSVTVYCFKGKGDALECGRYRWLKLLDHVMKVFEGVIGKLIWENVDIDAMQFGFMPGKGTTDAIFLVRQLQEKYVSKEEETLLCFC